MTVSAPAISSHGEAAPLRVVATTDASHLLGAPEETGEQLLSHAPPDMGIEAASRLAQTHYGISGTFERLSSERDANYRILMPDGRSVLLKITNAYEDQGATAMQTAALTHLAAVEPALPVQRVFETCEGKAWAHIRGPGGFTHVVRLLSYLDGTILHAATPAPGFHHQAGRTLARMTRALRGFFHEAAGRVLLWDIKQAGRLRSMLDATEDPLLRARLTAILDHSDAEIATRLPRLRAQVVHNDFNPFNVVVDGVAATHVTGVIDFGDMVHTALVCDLAVACSYQVADGASPLRHIADMVAGFSRMVPLEEEELALLPHLIRLRHAVTLIITAWRARRYPENAPYILRNVPAALRGLQVVDGIGPAAMRDMLHDAAHGMENQ